jgi:hypothetical protein
MNKKLLSPNILLVFVIITGISGVLGGIKHHETWRIVLGAVTLGLAIIAVTLKIITAYKQKV